MTTLTMKGGHVLDTEDESTWTADYRAMVERNRAIRARTDAEDAAAKEVWRAKHKSRRTAPDGATPSTDAAPLGAPEPMGGLLDDVRAYFLRYVHFAFPEQADAVALWTVYTHFFAAGQPFSWVPYLLVTSAEPLSGKTTMLDLADKLVYRPLRAESMSPAMVGREVGGRTLLLDEIDGVYQGNKSDTDGNALDLRTILNGGFGKDGTYARLVPVKGGGYEPKYWPTYGPKMLAGIGRNVPDTVKSRSIRLRVERKAPGTIVEKARSRIVEAIAGPLRKRIEDAALSFGELPYVDVLPDGLGNRDEDIWEPLISLADLASGSEWPETARAAATKLCASEPYMSNGVRLLSDIRDIFEAEGWPDHLSTKFIIGQPAEGEGDATGLCAVEEFAWANWTRGRAITAAGVAKLLGEFDLKSERKVVGHQTYGPSGYFLAALKRIWTIYLT